MRKLARKSPIAHEILYYLVEHMGRTTNAVVCSYTTLCEVTGVSRPTVGRAQSFLKRIIDRHSEDRQRQCLLR